MHSQMRSQNVQLHIEAIQVAIGRHTCSQIRRKPDIVLKEHLPRDVLIGSKVRMTELAASIVDPASEIPSVVAGGDVGDLEQDPDVWVHLQAAQVVD